MTDNLINNQDDDELSETQEYFIAGAVILLFGLLYWFLNHGWGAADTAEPIFSSKAATQEWHSASDVKMPAVAAVSTNTTASTPKPATQVAVTPAHAPVQAQQVVASTVAVPAASVAAVTTAPSTHPPTHEEAAVKLTETTAATTATTETVKPSSVATDAGPVGQPGATQPVQTAQAQPPEGAAIPAGASGVAADFETQLRQAMAKREVNQVFVFDKLQFESGSHKITASSDVQLHAVAALLQANPHIRVLIRGHTDETGIPGNNTELSLLRANEVGVALVNLGVDRRRLRIMGMGDSTPIADNATEAGRQLNRRVDLMILP